MNKLPQVMRINGVNVYVHWSVFVISIIILLGAIERPAMSLVGLFAYWSVLLIHECGHMIAAQRKGCHVSSIELYPIWGRTCFNVPWSRFDHCVIAWGGVLAQAVVAAPLVAWVELFGYTRFSVVNEIIEILGYFSIGTAILNLLPIPPLDGAMAWRIIPAYIERFRKHRKKQVPEWLSRR